jgi:hypothetical protein
MGLDLLDSLEKYVATFVALLFGALMTTWRQLCDPCRGSVLCWMRYQADSVRQIGPTTYHFLAVFVPLVAMGRGWLAAFEATIDGGLVPAIGAAMVCIIVADIGFRLLGTWLYGQHDLRRYDRLIGIGHYMAGFSTLLLFLAAVAIAEFAKQVWPLLSAYDLSGYMIRNRIILVYGAPPWFLVWVSVPLAFLLLRSKHRRVFPRPLPKAAVFVATILLTAAVLPAGLWLATQFQHAASQPAAAPATSA